jgi:hypothetical protein
MFDRSLFDCIGAHAGGPGCVRAGAAVEIDHRRDRFLISGIVRGEIGTRHFSKAAIIWVIAAFAEQFNRRRFDDDQTFKRNLPAKSDCHRNQPTKGMTNEVYRSGGPAYNRLHDLGFPCHGIIGRCAPLSGFPVSEKARYDAMKLTIPATDNGPPGCTGTT